MANPRREPNHTRLLPYNYRNRYGDLLLLRWGRVILSRTNRLIIVVVLLSNVVTIIVPILWGSVTWNTLVITSITIVIIRLPVIAIPIIIVPVRTIIIATIVISISIVPVPLTAISVRITGSITISNSISFRRPHSVMCYQCTHSGGDCRLRLISQAEIQGT